LRIYVDEEGGDRVTLITFKLRQHL